MDGGAIRYFAAPSRYLQGPGALELLGDLLAPNGTHPLVICDGPVMELLHTRVSRILRASGLVPAFRVLTGDITMEAAEVLASKGPDLDPDQVAVVVGLGGGKSLDAAKAVGIRLDRPVVTVPTIASNDSPTSAAVAMYDDSHALIRVDRMRLNPTAVVVDTELVAAAPATFLRAGVGDAIAKKYEAEGCLAGTGVTPLGTRPLLTGVAIADACYRTIRQHGVAGIEDCEAGLVTDDLEALVEAVVLMSGLGFENGGLSLSHSLTRGLMPARGAGVAMHGEHVAWALLVQRQVEGADEEELQDLTSFLQTVGLPITLAKLGMTAPRDHEVLEIVRLTLAAPHVANLAIPVSENDLFRAIQVVESRAKVSK